MLVVYCGQYQVIAASDQLLAAGIIWLLKSAAGQDAPSCGSGTARAVQCPAHFTQTARREQSTSWFEIDPKPGLLEVIVLGLFLI